MNKGLERTHSTNSLIQIANYVKQMLNNSTANSTATIVAQQQIQSGLLTNILDEVDYEVIKFYGKDSVEITSFVIEPGSLSSAQYQGGTSPAPTLTIDPTYDNFQVDQTNNNYYVEFQISGDFSNEPIFQIQFNGELIGGTASAKVDLELLDITGTSLDTTSFLVGAGLGTTETEGLAHNNSVTNYSTFIVRIYPELDTGIGSLKFNEFKVLNQNTSTSALDIISKVEKYENNTLISTEYFDINDAPYTLAGNFITEFDSGEATEATLLNVKQAFDEKYTGYVIDLDNSGGDPFNSFPFDCNYVEINSIHVGTAASITDSMMLPINRIEDLVDFLNSAQPYYTFVKYSDSKLGIMGGEFPVSLFSEIQIGDDSNVAIMVYDSSTLSYETSTIPYTTQDYLLQGERIKNSSLSGSNGRMVLPTSTVAFSATAVVFDNLRPYRKTITITNTSTSDLFIGVGATPTITNYKYRLPQNGVLIIDDTTQTISGIWDTGVANGVALVNITY